MKPLQPGEQRLLDDVARVDDLVDDRGLEFAEALLHERRNGGNCGWNHEQVNRAISAVENIRRLTKVH